MTILLSVVMVLVGLLLLQMVLIGADLRAVRYKLLPQIRDALLQGGPIICLPGLGHPDTHTNGEPPQPVGCFVLWEWRGGKWRCRAVPEGVDPGLSPSYPGAFEGDLAKTWRPLKS